MTRKKGRGDDADDAWLYPNDGSFKIKPLKIKVKKPGKKKKKDVKTELENTRLDLIQ